MHGGLAKAVYAYPQEHYAFWQTVRAQAGVAPWDEPLPPGSLGENLLLHGLLEDQLWIGDRLRIGDPASGAGCVLAVSEPRRPCFKFDAAMGFAQASRLMIQSGWCGAYLAVLEAGAVQAGDAVELVPGPREVNLRELFRKRAPGRPAAVARPAALKQPPVLVPSGSAQDGYTAAHACANRDPPRGAAGPGTQTRRHGCPCLWLDEPWRRQRRQ